MNPYAMPANTSNKFFPTMKPILFGLCSGSGLIPETFDEPAPSYSKSNVIQTPKIVIAEISSKLDAAINVVGIPFLVPYFSL